MGGFDPESFVGIDRGASDEDRARAGTAIVSLDASWQEPRDAVDIGQIRWRPDLAAGETRLLHLALSGEIPNALLKRMRGAHQAGYEITVALGSQNVDINTLTSLQRTDARIIFVEWEENDEARGYRSIADWIARDRISLSPTDLQSLASDRLSEACESKVSDKGRLFEEVLCLLFSQVSWLTVEEHAYRNDTEEIDLVLDVHATGHIAELAKGAVAIATAKNERTATGSSTVKYLKEQMANRKGRCKLGFLCSASSISREAHTEILRGSQSDDFVLVPMDIGNIRDLLEKSTRLDEGIQDFVRRAVNS